MATACRSDRCRAAGNISLSTNPSVNGTLQIYQATNTIYAGVISGYGFIIVGSTAGGTLTLAGNNTYVGGISADITNMSSATNGGLGSTTNFVVISTATSDGLNTNGNGAQLSVVYGGGQSNGLIGTTYHGSIFDTNFNASSPTQVSTAITIAFDTTTTANPGAPQNGAAWTGVSTIAGNINDDVNLTFDESKSAHPANQTVILSGNSDTIGNFKIGNSVSTSTYTSTVVVTGILGDNGTIGQGNVNPLLSVTKGGILAGTGTVNPITTISAAGATTLAGGTIRGGIPNGTTVAATNYGMLTLGVNGSGGDINGNYNLTINGAIATYSGGGTILTEVHYTGAGNTLTTNNFTQSGTAVGDASLINVSAGELLLGNTSANKLGTSTGKYINIVIQDTTGTSLVAGQNYTFTLVTTASGIAVNGLAAGATVDSSSTGVGLGSSGIANVSFQGSAYGSSIKSWSLINNGGNLQLSVVSSAAAAPESHHILLICVGVLGLGMGIRRRSYRGATSVA